MFLKFLLNLTMISMLTIICMWIGGPSCRENCIVACTLFFEPPTGFFEGREMLGFKIAFVSRIFPAPYRLKMGPACALCVEPMTSRRPTSPLLLAAGGILDRASLYRSSASVFVVVKLVVQENIYLLRSERKKLFFP